MVSEETRAAIVEAVFEKMAPEAKINRKKTRLISILVSAIFAAASGIAMTAWGAARVYDGEETYKVDVAARQSSDEQNSARKFRDVNEKISLIQGQVRAESESTLGLIGQYRLDHAEEDKQIAVIRALVDRK